MTRSRFRSFHTAVVTSGLTAAFSSLALAQEAVPPTEPVPAPVPVEPAPLPAPLPAPAVVETPAPAPVAVTTAAPDSTEGPAEKEEAPWYEGFTLGGFVDAYAALRSDSNSRPNFGGNAYSGYYHEAYVQADGFALAVGGLDAAYAGDKFGATLSLRFGPAANRFFAADMSTVGIQNVTQAFVTYKPTDKLTFDLGQFGTIYGAEVLESWRNVNYSRGALYYAMQPFWHTGLRANVKLTDAFALTGLVVNGVNNAFENNKSPSLGLQALITPGDHLALAVGYLGALNPNNGGNGPFQNFFDVVATVTAGDFKLVANADLNLYKDAATGEDENWWGISLAPAYKINDFFGVGARYEYLQDSANLWGMTTTKIAVDPDDANNGAVLANKATLSTLTATLDIRPVPGSAALVLRPEFRYELAGDYYFYDKENELDKHFWSIHLGAVVTSLP